MRADRLISIVMLLQTHEMLTALELAQELEVSIRTIYRDIIALNSAGIPIYTDRGPGGGIALLESYRTTLTGMSNDEAQALFMMSIPQALDELGVGKQLKRALLKLAAAMPPSQQSTQAMTQQRIYLDPSPWQTVKEPPAHLALLHEAVWQSRRVRLVFRGTFDALIDLEVEPLGLVAKMNTWYLVGKSREHMRVLRVADIVDVELGADHFKRDDRFDLVTFWSDWCADSIGRRTQYEVRLWMKPELIARLKFYLEESIRYSIHEDVLREEDGWKKVSIFYDNFFQARQSILGFGRAAEVVEPEVLRMSVIDFAHQILDFYKAEE